MYQITCDTQFGDPHVCVKYLWGRATREISCSETFHLKQIDCYTPGMSIISLNAFVKLFSIIISTLSIATQNHDQPYYPHLYENEGFSTLTFQPYWERNHRVGNNSITDAIKLMRVTSSLPAILLWIFCQGKYLTLFRVQQFFPQVETLMKEEFS